MWQDSTTNTSLNVYNTPGTFWVVVVDSNGCSVSDTVNVVYLDCESLIMPNVFTPNGDGVNDIFYVGGNYLHGESLIVYDRWGIEVYNSEELSKGWDGTNMHNGKKCEAGTYFYMAYITIFDGKHKVVKGYLSLFR